MATDLVKDSRDVEIEQLRAQLEELKSRSRTTEISSAHAPAYTEEDNRDCIQKELDDTEEFVINTLFPDGVKLSPVVKTYLTMKGTDEVTFINDCLKSFEKYARPYMSPDGTVILTGKPSELIRLAKPLLEKLRTLIGG